MERKKSKSTSGQSTLANNAVRLRKLSRKSVIGFGKYADNTVQEIIDCGQSQYLVWLYYNNSKIDFLDDIKAEVRIDVVIDKPAANKELGEQILHKHYQETWDILTDEEKWQRRWKLRTIGRQVHRAAVKECERREREGCKKSILQMFNHGKAGRR